MNLHTKRTNTTSTHVKLDEVEIKSILAEAVIAKLNEEQRKSGGSVVKLRQGAGGVKAHVTIGTRDTIGTAGVEKYADVTITVDHDFRPEPADQERRDPTDLEVG